LPLFFLLFQTVVLHLEHSAKRPVFNETARSIFAGKLSEEFSSSAPVGGFSGTRSAPRRHFGQRNLRPHSSTENRREYWQL
jgi:hypothetical protein